MTTLNAPPAKPASSPKPAPAPASAPASRPAHSAGDGDHAGQKKGFSLAGWLGQNEFALRRLHSLTGVVFGGYIVVHLAINATLIEGVRGGAEIGGQPTVYQLQVDKIHGLPFLWVIAFTAILLPILYHTIYGIVIMVAGRPNVDRYGYGKNWAYLLQRITAVILIAFIAFHYLAFKGAFAGSEFGQMLTFVPIADATQSTVNHMHAAWWVGYLIYPIGILAATFHLANGFWTAGVTWGLTISAKAQQLWLYACAGLFFLTTAFGFTALAAALAMEPTVGPLPSQVIVGDIGRVGDKAPGADIAEPLGVQPPGAATEAPAAEPTVIPGR